MLGAGDLQEAQRQLANEGIGRAVADLHAHAQ